MSPRKRPAGECSGVYPVLAVEEFHPFFFLLPDSLGLLEYLFIIELAWLVAMAIYGFALRKLVRNPRDSVVVFHRIFWRIFLYPKKTAALEAYDAPMSVATLDDFDAPILDIPADDGWSSGSAEASFGTSNADTAGGTSVGGTGMGVDMPGADVDVDMLAEMDGPPPEPEPMAAEDTGEIEINVELQSNAPGLAVAGMVGDTITVRVPCSAEDGIANRHVVHALCHVLQLESYQITLLRGHAKGSKTFRLAGTSLQKVQQRVMSASN
ncbi:MAG: DUF167 family protein [Planctomycetota bacterium]